MRANTSISARNRHFSGCYTLVRGVPEIALQLMRLFSRDPLIFISVCCARRETHDSLFVCITSTQAKVQKISPVTTAQNLLRCVQRHQKIGDKHYFSVLFSAVISPPSESDLTVSSQSVSQHTPFNLFLLFC